MWLQKSSNLIGSANIPAVIKKKNLLIYTRHFLPLLPSVLEHNYVLVGYIESMC